LARPSPKALDYAARVRGMSWKDLGILWKGIKVHNTPEWQEGKAFEFLAMRAFELSKLRVDYPFDVPPGGQPVEQIDGLVFLESIPFLIECKDRKSIDVEAIAKLRNQLLRRPPVTMGCVLVTGEFTDAALLLSDWALPHRIALWTGIDIDEALAAKDFAIKLRDKYEHLCKYGMSDHSPSYKALQVQP
jgi:Restriction endonuclease